MSQNPDAVDMNTYTLYLWADDKQGWPSWFEHYESETAAVDAALDLARVGHTVQVCDVRRDEVLFTAGWGVHINAHQIANRRHSAKA